MRPQTTGLEALLSSFQFAMGIATILLASGFIHLAMFSIFGTSWSGPLSLRKPALFGISGGLTIWSIAWLSTHLQPQKHDRILVNLIAAALLVEVALITTQFWRGVASHFNHSTWTNATIEYAMLGLILAVTLGIFYLTLRTLRLRETEPAMAIAIRGGMWLLSFSCGLGILTSVLGEISIASGRSYELWGAAGVLKFPHGVALHAIQLLPLVSWLARYLRLTHSSQIVQATLASQIAFLAYAVWQTSQGRDRFDWDAIGGIMLATAVLFGLFPAFALLRGGIRYYGRRT